MTVGDKIKDKYTLKELLQETTLFQYWKAEAPGEGGESQAFLILTWKSELPASFSKEGIQGEKSSFSGVVSSLEEDAWIFPFQEGKPLSLIVKEGKVSEISSAFKITHGILEVLKELAKLQQLPETLVWEGLWVDSHSKISVLDLGLWKGISKGAVGLSEVQEFQTSEESGEKKILFSLGNLCHKLLTGSLFSTEKKASQIRQDLPLEWDEFLKKSISSDGYKTLEEFSTNLSTTLELTGISLEEEDLGKLLLAVFLILIVLVGFFLYNQSRQQTAKENPGFKIRMEQINKERTALLKSKHQLHENMVYVPAGKFILGRDPSTDAFLLGKNPTPKDRERIADEVPAREVNLKGFWIDQYKVSFHDYLLFADFVALTNDHTRFCHPDEPPNKYHFPAYGVSENLKKKFPVFGIDWFDAYAYARFMSMELPTEAEWEKAAKGTPELWKEKMKNASFSYPPLYPWGNEEPGKRAQYKENCKTFTHEVPVATLDAYPEGKSIYGVYNMSGNVWEFARDGYQFDFFQTLLPGALNPYKSWETSDKVINKIVVKGGEYLSEPISLRIDHRSAVIPTFRGNTGFRCVIEDKEEKKEEKKK